MNELFINSKYTSWYFALMNSRKIRILDENEYYENHHVIPTKLGGNDVNENKVYLTYREHVVAHYLLTKMCRSGQNRCKMLTAFHAMVYMRNQDNQRIKKILPLRYLELAKKSIVEARRGTKRSEETRRRIAASRVYPTGKDHPNYGMKHTEETKDAIRLCRSVQSPTFAGKKHTEETKRKISVTKTGVSIKRTIISCPHCQKLGAWPLMKRWHFDNCREIAS